MKFEIPKYVRPFLWSYDIDNLTPEKDSKRIITNVLNYGTKRATDWLFSTFSKDIIKEAIVNPYRGEWNKKSIHLWALVFDVNLSATETKRLV